jgi:NO-binding membrane sensor protein with MHYT domain
LTAAVDDQSKLAFDFAKTIATQVITLSTGFLALTITFTKELVKSADPKYRGWLYAAWSLHLASIASGVWALMALTGTLMPGTPRADLSFGFHVRFPATLQLGFFGLGLGSMVIYGMRTMRSPQKPTQNYQPE